MIHKIYHAVWIVGIVAHAILVFETWQHIDLYSVKGADGETRVPLTYYFDLSLAIIALLTFLILRLWVSAPEKKMAVNSNAAE